MPVSDVYTARTTVTATPASSTLGIIGLQSTTAKRSWIVGVRVDIGKAASPAGESVLFQLVRTTTSVTGGTPSGTAVITPHDVSAPVAITVAAAGSWTTPPTFGTVFLWEQMLPATTGSSWEEFPPAGYEWQVPASATAGVLCIVTGSSGVVSTPFTVDLVFSE